MVWNRTFEEELDRVDVAEIRQLLGCSDVDQEKGRLSPKAPRR
jgi:hypothetical protein